MGHLIDYLVDNLTDNFFDKARENSKYVQKTILHRLISLNCVGGSIALAKMPCDICRIITNAGQAVLLQ